MQAAALVASLRRQLEREKRKRLLLLAKLDDAADEVRRTKNPRAALRLLGVTKGDASKGKARNPIELLSLADLYERLTSGTLLRTRGWGLGFFLRRAAAVYRTLAGKLRWDDRALAHFVTDDLSRRSPMDALREVARFAALVEEEGNPNASAFEAEREPRLARPLRTTWEHLNRENHRRRASGEQELELPPRPRRGEADGS